MSNKLSHPGVKLFLFMFYYEDQLKYILSSEVKHKKKKEFNLPITQAIIRKIYDKVKKTQFKRRLKTQFGLGSTNEAFKNLQEEGFIEGDYKNGYKLNLEKLCIDLSDRTKRPDGSIKSVRKEGLELSHIQLLRDTAKRIAPKMGTFVYRWWDETNPKIRYFDLPNLNEESIYLLHKIDLADKGQLGIYLHFTNILDAIFEYLKANEENKLLVIENIQKDYGFSFGKNSVSISDKTEFKKIEKRLGKVAKLRDFS